jgi:hypothetical protein
MRSDMWRKGTLEEKSSLACNYLDVRVSDAIHVFRLRQVGQVDAGIGRGGACWCWAAAGQGISGRVSARRLTLTVTRRPRGGFPWTTA